MEQDTLELPPVSRREKIESLKALYEIYKLSKKHEELFERSVEGEQR